MPRMAFVTNVPNDSSTPATAMLKSLQSDLWHARFPGSLRHHRRCPGPKPVDSLTSKHHEEV
jgi:hypothetical protein